MDLKYLVLLNSKQMTCTNLNALQPLRLAQNPSSANKNIKLLHKKRNFRKLTNQFELSIFANIVFCAFFQQQQQNQKKKKINPIIDHSSIVMIPIGQYIQCWLFAFIPGGPFDQTITTGIHNSNFIVDICTII